MFLVWSSAAGVEDLGVLRSRSPGVGQYSHTLNQPEMAQQTHRHTKKKHTQTIKTNKKTIKQWKKERNKHGRAWECRKIPCKRHVPGFHLFSTFLFPFRHLLFHLVLALLHLYFTFVFLFSTLSSPYNFAFISPFIYLYFTFYPNRYLTLSPRIGPSKLRTFR